MRLSSFVSAAVAALAACHTFTAGPPGAAAASAQTLSGLHHDGASLDHVVLALGHSVRAAAADATAALDPMALQSALTHGGRELTVFPATTLVTGFAGSILDAFLGVGVNEAVAAIFGRQPVPVDLAQLFEDALKEIDRIVGDRIAEAFGNEKKSLLDSLSRQVREYTRRANLDVSRGQVQDMLADASDLLAFFKDNGVVTNSAFQTTLALRLALLLELLQLDQLIGESEATLAVVRNNIRSQARTGRAALVDWAATFLPTRNTEDVDRDRKSSRRSDVTVCMDLNSPGSRLQKPDKFCKSKVCRSKHTFGHIRKRRIKRCLDAAETKFKSDVRSHARIVGLPQFRERNEASIFGEGFRQFLADLEAVEALEFEDVRLPEVGSEA